MALALRHGHVKCVEILMSTGSLMSDPMMTWLSQQFNTGNAIWYAYTPEMIKLLLVCNFQVISQINQISPIIQSVHVPLMFTDWYT